MTEPVLALTDEELIVLTGGTGPVVLPHASTLPDAAVDAATEAARRSLVARRVLTEVDGRAVAGPPVGALLELREGAPVVVVLHRLVGAAAEGGSSLPDTLSRYLHVVDAVVLTEDVTSDGVHTFGLARTDLVPHLLREFLVPADAAPAPSTTAVVVTPSLADPLPAGLGGPTVLAEMVVLHAAAERAPEVLTAALGPGGCFVGRSAGDDPPELHPVEPGAVVEEIVADIRAAGAAVSRAVADRT